MQDFTFVCPTEIIAFSGKAQMFAQLNCQLIACSCDTEETHLAWIKTPRKKGGLGNMQIPIMADTTKVLPACLHSILHSAFYTSILSACNHRAMVNACCILK